MDTAEAGRRGAAITNKKLTTEGRRKAALKGWKKRKTRLKFDAVRKDIGDKLSYVQSI